MPYCSVYEYKNDSPTIHLGHGGISYHRQVVIHLILSIFSFESFGDSGSDYNQAVCHFHSFFLFRVVNGTSPVYFAAKDGIYIYNELKNKAEKYGTFNDEAMSIAADINTGVVYFLNKQGTLCKLTEQGTKFDVIETIQNAEDITIDYTDNVYIYMQDKSFKVYNENNKVNKKVTGVPTNATALNIIKSPLYHFENLALIAADAVYYEIHAVNATAVAVSENELTNGASAMAGDIPLFIYFARDNKISEFNAMGYFLTLVFEDLSKRLTGQ